MQFRRAVAIALIPLVLVVMSHAEQQSNSTAAVLGVPAAPADVNRLEWSRAVADSLPGGIASMTSPGLPINMSPSSPFSAAVDDDGQRARREPARGLERR